MNIYYIYMCIWYRNSSVDHENDSRNYR